MQLSLPARATALLLIFVTFAILLMGGIGYMRMAETTRENAGIRIDRAARAAAAIAESSFDGRFSILRNDEGAPVAMVLLAGDPTATLQISPQFDALVDKIAKTNQGSANVFRFNRETRLFERFATTLRNADGTLARDASLGPAHAAYAALVEGRPYVGRVQVLDRFRLAYLTPILDSGSTVVGALAVDVGWVDDLLRAQRELRRDLAFFAVISLLVLTTLGALLLYRAFRPLRAIGAVAHRLALGDMHEDVPYIERSDDIGTLATGLSQVVAMQHKLEELAYEDQLTGVANRARFQRTLATILGEDGSAAVPAGLLMVDVDHFKEVNDAFGHAAGDALIRQAVDRLRTTLGPGDLLARIGGDEFAIVSRACTSLDRMQGLADAMMTEMERPFHLPQGEVSSGCSVGMLRLPEDADSVRDAIRNVDLALYQAKSAGRGRACPFVASMNEAAQGRLALGRELRTAIDEDALTVHFQPQVRLKDMSLHGVEALARWNHPQKGFIPPSDFIPVAEESGLIVDLGTLVLRQSCRVARQWLDSGFDFRRVSVNVSPVQIRQPDFEQVVAKALADTGLPARHLCLEVTERLFINLGEDRVQRALTALSDLGVQLSLDDFGTGYSSLSYLHTLPFHQLKIDRSFVTDIDSDVRRQKLFHGIVALGQGLGLHLVAEGAETEAEVAFLASVGCDSVQGYVFARPVAAMKLPVEADRIRRMRLAPVADPAERAAS